MINDFTYGSDRVMNKSVSVPSTRAITQRYHQLQVLRQLVKQAESADSGRHAHPVRHSSCKTHTNSGRKSRRFVENG